MNIDALIRSRKGAATSYNTLVMITRVIFLVVALLAIVLVVNIAINMRLDPFEAEASVIVGRMIYSPEGISKIDPITGRVIHGVIKLNTFTNERLDDGMFIAKNNRVAVRVEVYSVTSKENNPIFIKEAKFNSEYFDIYDPMAEAWTNAKGLGGIFKFERTYPVIIEYDDGSRKLGKADFKVLIPRRSD